MAELTEKEVGGEVSGAEMRSRARDEWFDVDVAFVDREQQIFCTILGGNRETAREVGEDCIASEVG